MKMVKNNKGFTLIELLAVIVILAVIILVASSNVGTAMVNAKKNALALEGNTLITSAKNAYQMAILNGYNSTSGACFSLRFLKDNGYFDKASDDYTGSVAVKVNDGGKSYDYEFWISNGNYVINNGKTGATGKSAEVGTSASDSCGTGSTLTGDPSQATS